MVPLPPNLISSRRRQRSGNLSPWFWTTSCSACSWPFASSGRSPSLLEGSSSSTCCEVTEQEQFICLIKVGGQTEGCIRGCICPFLSPPLKGCWVCVSESQCDLAGSYLKSVLSPTIFPLFDLFFVFFIRCVIAAPHSGGLCQCIFIAIM